jgi:hypothetical protein
LCTRAVSLVGDPVLVQNGGHPRDQWAMLVLGQWLLAWRLSTGATQRQVAWLAGIDQAHLCRIEQGRRRPSGVPLGRIIIALDWLSGGGDRRGPWSKTDGPLPSHLARWGACRPPAVVGREPLPPSADHDPAAHLDALLGTGGADLASGLG